jgi:hypothetical protein
VAGLWDLEGHRGAPLTAESESFNTKDTKYTKNTKGFFRLSPVHRRPQGGCHH